MNKGKLYLIPTLLAEGKVDEVLPEGTLSIIRNLEFFIVEEIRTARRFLIKAGITKKIDDLTFLVFNEHSAENNLHDYLSGVLNGHDIGLLSEAGAPCVALHDVQFLHREGTKDGFEEFDDVQREDRELPV